MANPTPSIVNKVWNYAHVLRDDGVSYGDYVEQITYLLFLKMAHEGSTLLHEESPIPGGYGWDSLAGKDGDDLEVQYRHVLEELGREPGMLGTIFRKAQNKIQDPAKLKRLISLMDGETWLEIDADIKGDIYEGLLERNAADVKSGAGQYFTPRPLIEAIVEVMRPAPETAICDPACGTGGFLLAAHEYVQNHYQLDRDQKRFQRDGFWATTSNKQLNFLQHVKSLLKIGGTAAVVVPDNVLFEGGAGETVRRRLLHEYDVHTLLRLPTGIFYAQGVKANVLFFDRKPASEAASTKTLWVYDLRT